MCKTTGIQNPQNARPKFEVPTYELRDIKAAIPPHLFKRSLVKSSAYLALDIFMSAVLIYLATYIQYLPLALRFVAWPAFWYALGVVWTGIWVIAHECGHQAFSDYGVVNDTVGWIFHSFLLVPYFSWKYTHGQHHSGTNDLTRDTVFVPDTHKSFKEKESLYGETPLGMLISTAIMLLFGWQTYLTTNVTGQKYNTKGANHFNPSSPFFRPSQRRTIVYSDIGIVLTLTFLAVWYSQTSFWHVFAYYLVPYFWVNAWLVTITYLQHTHLDLPHYRAAEWNFVRGALATVDRDYGLLNFFHHHISDSHVVHHLFSTMPHYNAIEATPYVRAFLGKHYYYDNTPVFKALWNTMRDCAYVPDEGDVVHFEKYYNVKNTRK